MLLRLLLSVVFLQCASAASGFLKTRDGKHLFYEHHKPTQNKKNQVMMILTGYSQATYMYKDTYKRLLDQGYEVYLFDYRCHGRSYCSVYSDNGQKKTYIKSFATYVNDLEEFMKKVVKPVPHKEYFVLAHSLGAHIATRYMQKHTQHPFRATFMIAPMMSFVTKPFPRWFSRAILWLFYNIGFAKDYAWKHGSDTDLKKFEGLIQAGKHRSIRSKKRGMELLGYMEKNKQYITGTSTFGWAYAAWQSVNVIFNPKNLKKLRGDNIFVFIAEDERIVLNDDIYRFVKEVGATPFFYAGARHDILRDKDEVVNKFWQDFKHIMEKLDQKA